METLRKLTNDLLELRYKVRTDDNIVTERQVQSWIRQQRSIWVSNELNKNRFEPAYWQETGKLDLIEHPTWGADYKTTVETIPPFIQVNHRPAVIKVSDGTPLGEEFPWVNFTDLRYVGNRRFDIKTIFCTLPTGEVILKRPIDDTDGTFDSLTKVNIVGIFEDPMDLKSFTKPNGNPQYHEDEIYPIHLKLYTYMREQIVKINFPVEAQSTQDPQNDGASQD